MRWDRAPCHPGQDPVGSGFVTPTPLLRLPLHESQLGHVGPMGKQSVQVPWLGKPGQVRRDPEGPALPSFSFLCFPPGPQGTAPRSERGIAQNPSRGPGAAEPVPGPCNSQGATALPASPSRKGGSPQTETVGEKTPGPVLLELRAASGLFCAWPSLRRPREVCGL